MTDALFTTPEWRGLRALIGYLNLDLAGVRRLTLAEERLADDLVTWWRARQAVHEGTRTTVPSVVDRG